MYGYVGNNQDLWTCKFPRQCDNVRQGHARSLKNRGIVEDSCGIFFKVKRRIIMMKLNFALAIVAGFVAVTMVGCKNQLENTGYTQHSVELGEIGSCHNEMLTELYQLNNSDRSADSGTTESDMNAFFGEYEIVASTEFSDNGIVDQLVEKDAVSNVAAEYMMQIEDLLNNPLDTFEEMIGAIVSIENDAKQVLNDTDYIEFNSYADTAKASLLFWTENIETIANMADSGDARWIIKDFFNKHKHKIGMAAASDAAGAALGAAIGSTIPGVGTATGAVIVGAASGAASSAMGYKEDKVCVVVALGSLADRR